MNKETERKQNLIHIIMETKLKCPTCGKTLEPGTKECPNCGEKIRHEKHASRNDLILDYVESKIPGWLLWLALLVAVGGQFLLLAYNPSFYHWLRPAPETSLFYGHLLKTAGETVLLLALMKGLANERHNLRPFFLAAIASLLLYHLSAMGFVKLVDNATLNYPCYYLSMGLLVVSTLAYLVLGFMLEERFYGGLFYLACMLILYQAVYFVFTVILKWSGHELFADVILMVLATIYLVFLRTRLLGHMAFKRYRYKRHRQHH